MVVLNCIAGPSRLPMISVRFLSTSSVRLSGHNRWSKIRHKKGAADAQRSALFSRLTNEIHQSMRPPNSPDPVSNTRLAAALAKARDGGVPKSAIENCLARARAAADGTGQTVMYEAVAAGGKAGLIMLVIPFVECLTDNPTRTVSRVKELLNKNNARMAPTSYLFEKKGIIALEPSTTNMSPTLEALLDISLDHGVEDVRQMSAVAEVEGEGSDTATPTPPLSFEIVTALSDLSTITGAFSAPSIADDWLVQSSEMSYEPNTPLDIVEGEGEGISEEKAESVDKLVDMLEMEADVIRVWTNLA